jgi:hypothetical protein
VISGRDDPFPAEAVRDLIGIVRALYLVAKQSGAGRSDLMRIERVGRDLATALLLARRSPPGTIGQSAAWKRAEEAALRAGDLVNALTPAEPLLQAARARVAGGAASRRKKAPER